MNNAFYFKASGINLGQPPVYLGYAAGVAFENALIAVVLDAGNGLIDKPHSYCVVYNFAIKHVLAVLAGGFSAD